MKHPTRARPSANLLKPREEAGEEISWFWGLVVAVFFLLGFSRIRIYCVRFKGWAFRVFGVRLFSV